MPMRSDYDYSNPPNYSKLIRCKGVAISYIAGYATKVTDRQLLCMDLDFACFLIPEKCWK